MKIIEDIGYAHVEIKGYRDHYGLLSEVELAGVPMLRIQEPDPETTVFKTHTYGATQLHGYHEMTEAEVLERIRSRAQESRPKRLAAHILYSDDDSTDEGSVDENHDTERPSATTDELEF